MSYIVYEYQNELCICVPTSNVPISNVIENDIPKNDANQRVPYQILNQLPSNYLESYDFVPDANPSDCLVQNKTKLHNIKKNEWRRLRIKMFEKYDILFIKALELNDIVEQQRITSIKQQLRDITSIDISSLSNTELENFVPPILNSEILN